jgi:hypothetical protein
MDGDRTAFFRTHTAVIEEELFHKARGEASEAGAKAWREGCMNLSSGLWVRTFDAGAFAARVFLESISFLWSKLVFPWL